MKVISEISVVSTLQDYQRFYRADPYSVHPRKVRSIESIYNIANNNRWEVKELNCLVTEPLFKSSGIERNVDGEVIAVKPGALSDDFLIDFSKCAKETEEEYMKAGLRQLQDGDIILLADAHAEGYIGYKTSIIRLQKNQKAMLLGHLIKVRPNKKEINPYYLLAYLNSEPARHFLNYSVRGQTVGLHASDAGKLPVLLPSRKIQDSIGDKLKQAIKAKIEAERKRKEIEEIFEKVFDIREIRNLLDKRAFLTFNYGIGECMRENRLDPRYFWLSYKKAIEIIKSKSKYYYLKDIKKEYIRGITPSSSEFSTSGEILIKVGSITDDGFINWNNVSIVPSDKYVKDHKKHELRKDDILITNCGVSAGKVSIMYKQVKAAITGEVTAIRLIDSFQYPYYVVAFLRSILGQLQIQRQLNVASGPSHLYFFQLDKIVIPDLPESLKTKIDNMMREYYTFSEKSKQLHFQAMEELNKLLGLNAEGDK